MKKQITLPEEAPQKIQRADIAPMEGFTLVVDSHFKTQYPDQKSAETAAAELLARFPMLQIEIYNAAKRERTKFS